MSGWAKGINYFGNYSLVLVFSSVGNKSLTLLIFLEGGAVFNWDKVSS